jgi:putative transposase
MVFDAHPEMRFKGGDCHFWAKGYYVNTVGKNEEEIRRYIKNQTEADMRDDE